jgi:tetratricopeptide (TPR) repeat protein
MANAHAFRALAENRLDEAVERFESIVGMPGPSPDRAYSVRANLACVLAAAGRHEDALACADGGVAEVRGMPSLLTPLHALRAKLLTRLGRLDAAREAIAQERVAAARSGDPSLAALADHDAGMAAYAAGDHAAAASLLARGLESDAAINRPLARLAIAESLARIGHADAAEAELREVTQEPVGPGDRPAALVARLMHVQALVARARGDEVLAERRLGEAAAAWRRQPSRDGGGDIASALVDLGRPTLAPVEPARELERVERELRHAPDPGAPRAAVR